MKPASGADCAICHRRRVNTAWEGHRMDSGCPSWRSDDLRRQRMTPIYGITKWVEEDGQGPRVLPRTVIYDPELTLTLPSHEHHERHERHRARGRRSVRARQQSGVDLMAEEASGPWRVQCRPSDSARRYRCPRHALYGACCVCVLGNVGMALHHKLCHTLGGSFNLPHAEGYVILPQAIHFQRDSRAWGHDPHRARFGTTGEPARRRPVRPRARQRRTGGVAGHRHERGRLGPSGRHCGQQPYWNPREIASSNLPQFDVCRTHTTAWRPE